MKAYLYLGIASALVPYAFIAACVAASPWFNFYNNALSDLGNYDTSKVAALYNSGLVAGGILLFAFSFAFARYHRGRSFRTMAVFIASSSVVLALIGVFPETAGSIHGQLSTLFFALIDISLLVYSYLSWPIGSPSSGAVSLVLGILSTIIWLAHWPWSGVAIQETLTSAMTAAWLLMFVFAVLRKGPA